MERVPAPLPGRAEDQSGVERIVRLVEKEAPDHPAVFRARPETQPGTRTGGIFETEDSTRQSGVVIGVLTLVQYRSRNTISADESCQGLLSRRIRQRHGD